MSQYMQLYNENYGSDLFKKPHMLSRDQAFKLPFLQFILMNYKRRHSRVLLIPLTRFRYFHRGSLGIDVSILWHPVF